MSTPKRDPLYVRYMETFNASTLHRSACGTCQNGLHCESGEPLYQAFVKAQDTYVARQSPKGRS